MPYGSETMPLLLIIRWMCGISIKYRNTSEGLKGWLELCLSHMSLEVVD